MKLLFIPLNRPQRTRIAKCRAQTSWCRAVPHLTSHSRHVWKFIQCSVYLLYLFN